ncbi:sulfite exporter TauE/SafE family protein [Rhizobiaceae bacterium BDR2-2]|uniref:Probable membrane transporter protein n=1 Tax=Ectorhizobium quercum TaxID=2965071 RepID=A0AAE3SW08_9HYPH|nr:sulfite exporter TauE/SafE family protein [Ectorhizobium quercum]MCX8998243.1 sulfite exporter TauE/SafE family protein [Ectorhizobium quercum]
MEALTLQSFLLFVAGLAVTGAAAGLLAGLLGVGGGIVIVPVLSFMLEFMKFSPTVAMHVAVGTSLLTIIPTSIMSLNAHNKRGAMDKALIRSWAPFVALGAAVGGIAAHYFSGASLKSVFGFVALAVAINMLLPKKIVLGDTLPQNLPFKFSVPGAIGFISSLMGIGGGSLTVPTLAAYSYPVHKAVGSSSAFGLIISLPAVVGFVVTGLNVDGLPPLSLGYVNLLAAALIIPLTMTTAKLGVRLAHSLQPEHLKRAFAVFLMITSIRMLWPLLAG